MKKYELKALQTEIKGATPEERASGYHARYLLLTYAFLRGIPYEILEKKVREHNDPYARTLQKEAARFLPDTTLEACEAWLKRAEAATAEEVAA